MGSAVPVLYCECPGAARGWMAASPAKAVFGAQIDPSKWHFVDHHLSHAASAFHASPYERAAVMTLDGRGEKATTSYYLGNGNSLGTLGQVNLPHSLGLLYERMTTYLGFLHSSDEYKVMALASYGKPIFADTFRSIIHVSEDGTYTIDDIDFSLVFGPARNKGDGRRCRSQLLDECLLAARSLQGQGLYSGSD